MTISNIKKIDGVTQEVTCSETINGQCYAGYSNGPFIGALLTCAAGENFCQVLTLKPFFSFFSFFI